MRLGAAWCLLLLAGCSTVPSADFMDRFCKARDACVTPRPGPVVLTPPATFSGGAYPQGGGVPVVAAPVVGAPPAGPPMVLPAAPPPTAVVPTPVPVTPARKPVTRWWQRFPKAKSTS